MDLLGFITQVKVRQCFQCEGDTEFYCYSCKHDLCLQCQKEHDTNSHTKCHEVVFYRTKYYKEGFSMCYKVRQCFQCQGDTTFYCNTCEHDLCLQCEERHVINLNTIDHDVVFYREKYENIPEQEPCVRHRSRVLDMVSQLRVNFQCQEHRKHRVLDIRTSHETNRQQHRKIIHYIRSDILYKRCFHLAEIKFDIKTCPVRVSERHAKMLTKVQRLKNLINTVVCDVKAQQKSFMTHRLQKQNDKINRHIASIENYEHRFEQLANKPVKLLSFLKTTYVLKIRDYPILSQQSLFSITDKINLKDVFTLVGEFQIINTARKILRNEDLLHQLSSSMLLRFVFVKGFRWVKHISHVTSDKVWVSDVGDIMLINRKGDMLCHPKGLNVSYVWCVHTVNMTGELIYIDWFGNINTLSKDYKTKSTLIVKTETWEPLCVFCCPSNGDLLVLMFRYDPIKMAKVSRYNDKGQLIQTVQNRLYHTPGWITENRNGDVIVSDADRVVVTERGGRHRFSYTGPPSGSELKPLGVCTDVMSHILVCDDYTNSVQMIDQDGHFLSLILTEQQGVDNPISLSYDNKTHLLWVGSCLNNRVCVYRYIDRID